MASETWGPSTFPFVGVRWSLATYTSLSPRLCSQGSALDLGSFRTGRYFSGYRSATSSGWILLWPDCGAQHTLEEISVLDNPAIRHPKTLIKRNCQAIALLVLSSSALYSRLQGRYSLLLVLRHLAEAK